MAYQSSKPESTDILSQSQSDIKGNFTSIESLVGENHVTFDIPNAGKHKHVTLPEQAAAPATAIDEIALYAKAVGGNSALFIRPENSGTEIDISTAVTAAIGTCTLPSGIILKWGTGTANQAAATTFAAPFPTGCLNVSISPRETGGSQHFVQVKDGSLTAAQFQTYCYSRSGTVNTTGIYYFAIGY